MDVVLRFLAALALAHLLQCLRDTNALHPVFSDRANAGSFFLQCSRDWIQPFPADLRKILTGRETARPSGAKPLSCGEVVIGKTLPTCSDERIGAM